MEFRQRYGPWALVTGASAGLGREFARQLAARGLNLVLVARRAEALQALGQALEAEHGIEWRSVALDLAQTVATTTLLQVVQALDIGLVIANAGFGYKGAFLDGALAADQDMISLHAAHPVALAHGLLPPMVARGHGGFLVVASMVAYQATPYATLYGATKAFQLSWAEGLSHELRPHGVDVLALCPGSTDTEFHQRAGGRASLKRMARPEAVVRHGLARLPHGGSSIPGWRNRSLLLLSQWAPRRWAQSVSARLMRRSQGRPPSA